MYLNILRLVLFEVDSYYDNRKKEKHSGEYRTLRRYINWQSRCCRYGDPIKGNSCLVIRRIGKFILKPERKRQHEINEDHSESHEQHRIVGNSATSNN